MPYTIQKRGKVDEQRGNSYSGITWDKAGIRSKRKPQYADDELDLARDLAKTLTLINPVGFVVVKVQTALDDKLASILLKLDEDVRQTPSEKADNLVAMLAAEGIVLTEVKRVSE